MVSSFDAIVKNSLWKSNSTKQQTKNITEQPISKKKNKGRNSRSEQHGIEGGGGVLVMHETDPQGGGCGGYSGEMHGNLFLDQGDGCFFLNGS